MTRHSGQEACISRLAIGINIGTKDEPHPSFEQARVGKPCVNFALHVSTANNHEIVVRV